MKSWRSLVKSKIAAMFRSEMTNCASVGQKEKSDARLAKLNVNKNAFVQLLKKTTE